MNLYETLLIVHPALESGRLKDIILLIEEDLKKEEIEILSIDVWGKKRLAYLIEKQKYGTFIKFQFSSQGNSIKKIEMKLQHNANILSYLTTSISKSEISEQKNSLDDQIDGQYVKKQNPEIKNIEKKSDTENLMNDDSKKIPIENKNDDLKSENDDSELLENVTEPSEENMEK